MRELKVKGFFDDDDFEFRIKRIKITAPKTTSQKEQKIVYGRKNYFSFSTSYSPRNFKEIIVKNRGSSANIQKTTAHSLKHNTRTESKEPEHLLPQEYRLENEFWNCGISEKEVFQKELQIWRENKTSNGGKTPKFENSRWELEINLNHTHTMENAKEIAEHIAKKFNFTATRIAIHRDEGYLKDLDNDITLILKDDKQGNKQNAWRDENTLKYYRNAEMTDEITNIGVGYNYHAHLNFVTLKDAKQNMRRTHITAEKLSDLQTEIAEMLQMERGEKVKNHENRRLSHKNYRATMRAMEQNDDFINKKELSAIMESIRKDNIGKGLKQDFFKELTAFKNELLKEKQVKIDDLQQKLDDFSKKFDITMYDLAELKKKNDELKKENERLKAENLAQAQKIAELENAKKQEQKAIKNLDEIDYKLKRSNLDILNDKIQEKPKTQTQEVTIKSTEKPLETQNDTLNNKIQAQDLKTPENAQNEPKTKAENDLEILENMPNAIWSKKQISTFLEIAKPLKISDIQTELDYYSKKIQENVDNLSEPSSLSYVKTELKNIIAKEKAKSVGQEPQQKSISDDEKRRQAQLKEIERLKAQGYFNLNTNSQSKDNGRDV